MIDSVCIGDRCQTKRLQRTRHERAFLLSCVGEPQAQG